METNRVLCLCLLLITSCYLSQTQADEHNHKYNDREEVVLWMSTVGPYHNRLETYAFFSLPFCSGQKPPTQQYHRTLSEVLEGVDMQFSGYEMEFKSDVSRIIICEVMLQEDSTKALIYAVENEYWYQMYIDGLPIWGKVGERDERDGKLYIFTHKKFDIGYNGQQIVDINVTTDARKELKAGARIDFSYEVNWKPSKVEFKNRFDKYLDPNFVQPQIYWFGIFKSFLMIIFLVGLVSMILLRILRKDYVASSKDKEVDDIWTDLGDEFGCLQVHGKEEKPHKQENKDSMVKTPALG